MKPLWHSFMYCDSFLASLDSFDLNVCNILYNKAISFDLNGNGYNFLSNDMFFNCFTPLESSQSPLFISGCIFASLDSFNLNAFYTVLYNQAVSFDSFNLCNNIEEIQLEIDTGD